MSYRAWYLCSWIWCDSPREAIALANRIALEWRKPSISTDPDLARWADDGGRA